MIVSAFITDLNARFPHSHSSAEVVGWINEVDRNVYPDTEKNLLVAYYQRVANVSNIAFPTGVEFEDIESMSVNGFKYWPADLRTISSANRYYYEEDGKIEIRPISTTSDIEYISGAAEITFGTNTITTTGDDFAGFSIGDIIKVTGCLLKTANNKSATLVSVTDKVLTFNPGTFGIQAEAAAITIQAPKIKLVYVAKPTDNAGDETGLAAELRLPKRFQDIYRYYLMAQISIVRKEFGDYSNYISLFNARQADYFEWYLSRQGIKPVEAVVMDGGW